VVLADDGTPDASRHHAEVIREHGAWWIADMGAANGTLVNGRPIRRQRLCDGDRVELGAHVLVIRITRDARRWLPVTAATVLVLMGIGTLLLWGRRPAGFENAAAQAAGATYLLATEHANRRVVVGTAFAVSADGLFATNAHVVREVERRAALGERALAIRSEPTPDVRPLVTLWTHARWAPGSIRDDVAVVRVGTGMTLTPMQLADAAALARLHRGTAVALFGFAAVSTDGERPRGRLSVDVLGDIRGERYFAVGLNIFPGTSGSPIFLTDGTVVALAAGGDFVPTANGTAPSGSGANWGVSVAALRELLATITHEH
jgi:S1-C subfamily serine protease